MTDSTQRLLPTALLLLACAASSAGADERFRLEGRHPERGAFRAEVLLSPRGDSVAVERLVHWADGSKTLYSGTLAQDVELLRGHLETQVGLTGSLRGSSRATIGWAFRRGPRCASRAREASGTTSEARGVRLEGTKSEAEAKTPAKKRSLKGRLLGLASSEAERALRKGAKLDVDLGRFAHVAVRGKIEQIPTGRLSPSQREALGRGPSVWIATELEGGARLEASTQVELGGAALSLGFRSGAQLAYRVVERYPLKSGQSASDWVRELASRAREAHSLPLSAGEASALELGSLRALSGSWNVLFSGSLALGEPSEGRLSLGGSYQLRDHFLLEVERLSGRRVRLRLLRTKTKTLGVKAKALFGLALEERLVELAPSASFVARKAGDAAEKAVRVELELSAGSSKEREFELSYELDLGVAAQSRAYERALRGDWRQLDASGAQRLLRRVGLERRRHAKLALGIGALASFERTRAVTRSEAEIRDSEGSRVERGVRLERGKKSSWFGKEEEHRLLAEGLWTLGAGRRDLTIRVRYQSRDERTSKGEFRRLRGALVAAGFGQAAAQERSDTKTRAELELKLERGSLELLRRAGRERALRAYAISVQAISGKTQLWLDPARRNDVRRRTRSVPGSSSRRRVPKYPTQRRHLRQAERFAEALASLASARSQEAQEERFLELAKTYRWELYEIAALARLVGGPAHAELRATLGGEEYR